MLGLTFTAGRGPAVAPFDPFVSGGWPSIGASCGDRRPALGSQHLPLCRGSRYYATTAHCWNPEYQVAPSRDQAVAATGLMVSPGRDVLCLAAEPAAVSIGVLWGQLGEHLSTPRFRDTLSSTGGWSTLCRRAAISMRPQPVAAAVLATPGPTRGVEPSDALGGGLPPAGRWIFAMQIMASAARLAAGFSQDWPESAEALPGGVTGRMDAERACLLSSVWRRHVDDGLALTAVGDRLIDLREWHGFGDRPAPVHQAPPIGRTTSARCWARPAGPPQALRDQPAPRRRRGGARLRGAHHRCRLEPSAARCSRRAGRTLRNGSPTRCVTAGKSRTVKPYRGTPQRRRRASLIPCGPAGIVGWPACPSPRSPRWWPCLVADPTAEGAAACRC